MRAVPIQSLDLAGTTVHVVRPDFYGKFDEKNEREPAQLHLSASNGGEGGFCGEYSSLASGYRHIAARELIALFDPKTYEHHKIFAEIMLQYVLEWVPEPIWVDECVRREGNELLIYRGVAVELRNVNEDAMYDSNQGYRFKSGQIPEAKRFRIDRLLEKYNGADKPVPMRFLDKANCDLLEDLFGLEFESLPAILRNGTFMLPPDASGNLLADTCWRHAQVWPLAVAIKLTPNKEYAGRWTIGGCCVRTEVSNGHHVTVKI